LISSKLSKRDRFGIYVKIENLCLDIMNLAISASLEARPNKLPLLNSARIKIEALKIFFRIAHELDIINQKLYIELESDLQEISKMANGWIKYLRQ
jgi:hypothetical protein